MRLYSHYCCFTVVDITVAMVIIIIISTITSTSITFIIITIVAPSFMIVTTTLDPKPHSGP